MELPSVCGTGHVCRAIHFYQLSLRTRQPIDAESSKLELNIYTCYQPVSITVASLNQHSTLVPSYISIRYVLIALDINHWLADSQTSP
jgi:hypothetical protein